jgi:hypothetical protein
VSGLNEWKPHAESGSVRILAISSAERIGADSPPTMRESGLDVVVSNWRAAVAPPGTDGPSRDWLVQALARMQASATWQETIRKNDWVDSFLAGPELEAFIDRETESNAAVLSGIGLVSLQDSAVQYAAVGPWVVPAIVGAGLMLSALWLLISSGRSGGRRSSNAVGASDGPPSAERVDWRTAAATAGLLLSYIFLLNPLGYLIATALFLFLEARILGSRSPLRDGLFSIIMSAAVYILFNLVLKIGLPPGVFG